MKYHPQFDSILDVTKDQYDVLQAIRQQEYQSVVQSFDQKARRLAQYCQGSGISAVVLGLSGGIDSALTMMLAKAAGEYVDGPWSVIPVFLPTYGIGATGQVQAYQRALSCAKKVQLSLLHWDLTHVHEQLHHSLEHALTEHDGIEALCLANSTKEQASVGTQKDRVLSDWAAGQMVATVRTPALYGLTSVLSDRDIGALVLGTTNYDEGSFIGYVGKASDAMVDVQVLSDWHKSEVYALASHQGVCQSVLECVPTGDMHDGRTDEQVFGFSYDALEWDLRCRYMSQQQRKVYGLVVDDSLRTRIQALHQYNAHKYLGASVSVHLDVFKRPFEGSWHYRVWDPVEQQKQEQSI